MCEDKHPSSINRPLILGTAWGTYAEIPRVEPKGVIPPRGPQGGDNMGVPWAMCPVHKVTGFMTSWRPRRGLDPLLREFYCELDRHAFYKVIHREPA